MLTYLVGCSLNATTILGTLDLQNGLLTGLPTNPLAHTEQWTLWSPANASSLNTGVWF